MTLKSNQSTVHGSSNGACKVSQYSANKRDLSYSRPTDRHHRRHSQFNKAAGMHSDGFLFVCDNGIGRSTKYYSTYQLNNRSRDSSSSSSSVSSDYSSDDSPTLASHSSSGECSTSLDDNSDLHRTSRYKVKNRPSLPVSRAYRDPLPDSPVLKSILRDDRFKQQRNSHRSSSLCKPVSHRIPLRSVTNIQDNYGSLNHLNAVPLNQTAHVNSTPNSKPVHNLMNTFGGSVPVVGNPEASGESVYYPSYPLVRQQSSRIYTAFESIHRRPSVPIQPSVYFYPSTERILYSHPVHQTVASEQCHDGGVCSPRIPTNLSNNCVVTSPKPMTCGACGGSGQILGGGGNLPNSRFIEPPLIRPNIGLSPLYRKTLSSASLFENENVCRNFNTNSTVNPSTHYHEPGRMDYTARFGSLTHVNKRSHSKSLTHRKYSHLMMMNQSNHQNPNTNSSEDSGSGTTSGEKSCCRKQNNRVNDNHHLNSVS
ncbi:unnamed protein product [Trichobilharzia regenti]|nr:unnamed protein product [Trichobilharzia regenti]